MLHWICPECGRDCSPAIRECPVCASEAQQQPATADGVLALARILQAAPPVAVNGGQTKGTVALTEEEPASLAGEAIDSMVRPLIESAEVGVPITESTEPAPAVESASMAVADPPAALATPSVSEGTAQSVAQPAESEPMTRQPRRLSKRRKEASTRVEPLNAAATYPPVEPVAASAVDPPAAALVTPSVSEGTPPSMALPADAAEAVSAAEPASVAIGDTPAEPAEPVDAATAEPPVTALVTPSVSEGPPPSPLTLVESVEPAPTAEPASVATDDPPAPPPVESAQPIETIAEPVIEAATTEPSTEQTNGVQQLAQALELEAETLVDAIARQVEAHAAGVRAVAASFEERPKTSLLTAASEIVAAPAPSASQWIRTPRPAIPTRKLNDPSHTSLASGPQTSTLAGPCLPRELLTFIEQPSAGQRPPQKPVALPAWIISLIVATSLFLGAGRFLQYLTNNKNPNAAAAQGQQLAQPAAAASAEPTVEAHPFARFVEVTGLRVVADLSHKSQVQYLVVNHSPSHISGVALKITVKSSESPGATLFTVSSVIPSLAPYQSKEIRTDLDAELRLAAIPDWQYLHTEVQVGTQQ